jgi:hypothetical protein
MAWTFIAANLASVGMVGVAGIAAWSGDYGWALGFIICAMLDGVVPTKSSDN